MSRRRKPAPILSPIFVYDDTNNAASHSNVDHFRERQRERMRQMQAKSEPVNVTKLKRKA